MSEREKWEKFVDCLEQSLRIDVCVEICMRFEKTANLAVWMDVILNGGKTFSWGGFSNTSIARASKYKSVPL